MFTIGCHLSASKGYLAMAKQAVSIGANTFQFFTRNPRGGKAKEINEDDVKAFLEYSKEHGINRILAHAPYTLNACSADSGIREFAKNTMADDLKRMEYTPGNYYNFHPGSHVGQGVEVGIDFIAEMLNEILTKDQTTIVLLETMSGKGSEVGRNFEELKAIIDKVKLKDKLGVCLDTCHLNDAGYDMSDFDSILDLFDNIVGIDKIYCVHINDSMNVINSHKDRHANIGFGTIGFDNLLNVIYNKRLSDIPMILETPYVTKDDNSKEKIYPPYKYEIEMIRNKKFDSEMINKIREG